MILLDTSGLLAALFPDQRHHRACAEAIQSSEGPFILSPFVLAELDYLITKLAGVEAELAMLSEVARGAYTVPEFGPGDVEEAMEVIRRHANFAPGLADASLVVLSGRYRCLDLLTLDERHFRVLGGFMGRPFRVLPADL